MSDPVKIASRDISVKQLTMAEIRKFVAAMQAEAEKEDNKAHVLDMLFDDPVPAAAVSIATGLSMDELGGSFSQDEMRELLDKVKAVNPFFVGMMERLIEAGRQLNKT